MIPALSIRAPWWWLILHAGKRVENRSWSTKYRGPVLLHASSWFKREEVGRVLDETAGLVSATARTRPPTPDDFRFNGGAVVGKARIVDCVAASDSPWFFGPYGLVLEEVEALRDPIPLRGRLGLFDPQPPVVLP